jgi:IS30 family transposase
MKSSLTSKRNLHNLTDTTDLSTVTRKERDHATERLNRRPRKRLGFRPLYEVFFHTRTSLTVALPT